MVRLVFALSLYQDHSAQTDSSFILKQNIKMQQTGALRCNLGIFFVPDKSCFCYFFAAPKVNSRTVNPLTKQCRILMH